MAEPRNKLLALDTNILVDLAAQCDFAWDFLESYQNLQYRTLVTPTVLIELEMLTEAEDRTKVQLAEKALQCIRSWGIVPQDLPPVAHAIADQFSEFLRFKGLLPAAEMNDGLIIAEAGLAEVPVLVTSDRHLLDIDPNLLSHAFTEKDISPVIVAHPKNLRKAIR